MASATDAEEALRATHGKENCQRLNRLLMRGGVSLLKEKFDSFHSPTDLPLKLGDPATQAQLKRAKISKPEWDCLYPSPGTFGKSTDFDITLTFRLLRTICNLTPPLTGWDNLPNSADQSLEADFARIKYYRNTVYGHNKKMEITNSEFCQHWKEIRDVLLRIAGSISSAKRDEWKMSIDGLLHDPLTPEAQRYVDELQLWYKKDMDVKDGIERVEDGQKQMNVHIRSQNQQMNQMNQRQVEMNQRLETLINIHVEGNRQDLPANIWTVILSFKEQIDGFLEYLKDQLRVTIASLGGGSLLITVTCSSLQILEGLWADYCSGHLNKVAEQKLVTPDVLERLRLSDLKLKTTIADEEYQKCKEFFMRADQCSWWPQGASSRPTEDVPVEVKNVPEANSSSRQPTQARSKAIPLCLPNNLKWNPWTGEVQKSKEVRRTLYIVEDAVAELSKIKDPVCVVSIVGPCRDGKSFILSEAFSQPEVFPVGFEMDPKTMGIWIWILPHTMKDRTGRDLRVVLLDSEGTEFAAGEGQQDAQIFTLTVLMASMLIYNSKGVPKRNDLNQLDFVVKLSQRIQARSDGTTRTRMIKNEDAFHKTFPHFIWLLRDVMTDIPGDCKDIKDYFLTRVFKGSETSQNDRSQYIAESIMHYFSGFDAFCLPPPAFNKEMMKDIKRNKDRMNPEFFSGVEQFKDLLKSNMGPKKSCNEGEYVTGEGLATLTKIYVDAINDPRSIPNVQTAWETFVQGKCQEAKKKALLAYDKKMKSALSMLPCDGEKILASHESAIGQSMAIFNEETVGLASDNTKQVYEEIMDTGLQKLGEWTLKNDRLTKEACEKLLEVLKRKHLDPVLKKVRGPDGISVSYKDIDDGCAKIENEYKNTVGSKRVRAQVFLEFHERLKAEQEQYQGILKKLKDYDENLLKQRRENADKDKETERLRERTAYLEKQKEIQDKKLKDLEEKKQQELIEKIREFQAKQDILHKKIHDMEKAGMEKRIHDLVAEVNEAREEKQQWEKEIRDLNYQIAELAEQLRLSQRPWYDKILGIDE